MSSTLNSPVYEVKQVSKWFQLMNIRRIQQEEFFEKINYGYFIDDGFSYSNAYEFGVQADSGDYDYYKDELLKKPNKDGVHPFKKSSKFYPIFRDMLRGVEDKDPFKAHDVFGLNNISGSHWVGDRWFFGVRNEELVIGEEAESIDYKDYLKVVINAVG